MGENECPEEFPDEVPERARRPDICPPELDGPTRLRCSDCGNVVLVPSEMIQPFECEKCGGLLVGEPEEPFG